jgi:hypothetical protein
VSGGTETVTYPDETNRDSALLELSLREPISVADVGLQNGHQTPMNIFVANKLSGLDCDPFHLHPLTPFGNLPQSFVPARKYPSKRVTMKLMIPLKDIMITPGQRIDLSEASEEMVIEKIRKA